MLEDCSPYNSNGYRGFVLKEYASRDFTAFLDVIDDWVGGVEERHYKEFAKPTDRMVTVVTVPLPGGEGKALLKQDDFRRSFNLAKTARYAFKISRGKRGWSAAMKLRKGGVPVPEPIAYIEKRSAGLFVRGYFIMEYLDGAVSLRDSLTEGSDRDGLVASAARAIRDLHELGCTHGDLKSTNFLVRQNKEGKAGIYLIDTEDVRCRSEVSKARRVADLVDFLRSLPGRSDNDVDIVVKGYDLSTSITREVLARRL